eukprot:1140443-Pelagomonas_calceolata.AAC.2
MRQMIVQPSSYEAEQQVQAHSVVHAQACYTASRSEANVLYRLAQPGCLQVLGCITGGHAGGVVEWPWVSRNEECVLSKVA